MAGDRQPSMLVCPSCGGEYPVSERFCGTCGMPLVYNDQTPDPENARVRERRAHARKIKPQYSEGRLVKAARTKDQVEAELIAGLLLEEGIPSTLSNAIAGYAPLIGPWDVLVPESGVQAAREALRAR